MSRTAFVFPGQGAQYAGMAKEFYDTYEVSRAVFAKASEVVGFSVEELCFSENEKLHETRYTQPALLTACCAILKAVEQAGIRADMTAGLSLGEYCALVASGALAFEDAVRIVGQRGIYMAEAVPAGQGAMMAIISRKEIPTEAICEETEGIVTVANYNCPGQRVISGETEAVKKAAEKLLEAGAARAVPLQVSGPFHSELLKGAGEKLAVLLEDMEIHAPELPFVSNVTAQAQMEPEEIRTLLGQQVYSSVKWEQSMESMIREGVDTVIEIGPGKTLGNFAKKISRNLKVYQVERPEDLEVLKEELLCCREK